MGSGPVPATRRVLQRAGLKLDAMDVIEANEAFAAQACAVSKELGFDPAKVNPNASGISIGHPVGATGAIIATQAIYELQRIGGRYALVTMCIGGRSEKHTSELQSLMRISYAVFCLHKQTRTQQAIHTR